MTSHLARVPQYGQVTAFWEPFEYFLNSNKRGYRQVNTYASEIERVVAKDACFWGNEATMLYPMQFYYQDVLERRMDVSSQLVFGMLERDSDYRAHANLVRRQLGQGCPVYFSSLGFPECRVLNEVFSRLDRNRSTQSVAALSQEALLDTFPRYQLEPITLDGDSGVVLWKFVERRQGLIDAPPVSR